jgi:D-3-phosphoglycerate dehydrogenase
MPKPFVFVTNKIREEGIKLLEKVADVYVFDKGRPANKAEIIMYAKHANALLVQSGVEQIDKDVIDSIPNLKIISRHGVGYDNVDVNYATKKGIIVTIARTANNADSVAELTFALLLALARKICLIDKFVKSGEWQDKPNLYKVEKLGVDVFGKVLGIIGLGNIGLAVAKRAKGFDMNIIYYDIIRREDVEKKMNIKFVSFKVLLQESDFITIHVPLSKDTYHLIGEKELKMMKNTAYIINTARGPLIDEKALYKALKEGWIAGAGLDVFEQEPVSKDNPLLKLDNVVLTSHVGGATIECRKRLAIVAADNIIRVLQGKVPDKVNIVNPEVVKKLG